MMDDSDSTQYYQNGQLKLPVEMWTLIFNELNEPCPKMLVGLREVCKFWRKVIDEHVSFKVNIGPRFDVASHSHLRVKEFTILNRVTYLSSEICLFSDPKLVTKLSLFCIITRQHFFALVTQFTNLNELSLALHTPEAFAVSTSQHEAKSLAKFLGNLKKLKVDNWTQSIGANYLSIISYKMPKLSTLSIYIRNFNVHDSGLVPFLNERVPNLEYLKITCGSEYRKPKRKGILSMDCLEIKPVQLRALEVKTKQPFWKINWVPVFRLQGSLEKIRIEIQYPSVLRVERFNTHLKLKYVEDILVGNVETLKSLELEKISLSAPPNASLFQRMTNLKTFVLTMQDSTRRAMKGFNLTFLPESIETLKLKRCTIGNKIPNIGATNLRNLKSIEFDEINIKTSFPNPNAPQLTIFFQLMISDVWNLTTLSLKFHKFNLDDSGFLPFLMDKAPNLKYLRVICLEDYMPAKTGKPRTCTMNLRPLHLKKIELSLTEKCFAASWMPVIKVQRSLETLRFRHFQSGHFGTACPAKCLAFSDLEETLYWNKETLKKLAVGAFTLSENLDAGLFQEMTKLEDLSLCHHPGYPGSNVFKVFNLSKLPKSVEYPVFFHLDKLNDEESNCNLKCVHMNKSVVATQLVGLD